MAKTAFTFDPVYTGIVLAYQNSNFIADQVLPRAPVAKQEYRWRRQNKADHFTIVETNVGRTSQVNRIEYGGDEETSSTRDRALETPIPDADIANAKGTGVDPQGQAAESNMAKILLDRERRVAQAVFNPDVYADSNKEALTAADRFDDPSSDALGLMMDVLDRPIYRPNKLAFGQREWTKFRQNPAIVKAINGNDGGSGIVSRQQVAALLEVDTIVVGQARLNTSGNRNNQDTTQFDRLWAGGVLAYYQHNTIRPDGDPTFGWTAEWGKRTVKTMRDESIGARGGRVVRVYESTDEHIASPDVAYLLTDVIAEG